MQKLSEEEFKKNEHFIREVLGAVHQAIDEVLFRNMSDECGTLDNMLSRLGKKILDGSPQKEIAETKYECGRQEVRKDYATRMRNAGIPINARVKEILLGIKE